MEILILLGLIVLNGVFAMTEIALVTSRKARLKKLATEGSRSAEVALNIAEDPTRFLSTIQIGITSISILNGIIGEALFAASVSVWLQGLGMSSGTAAIMATSLVVVVVTYVSIVVGELVPKRLGQINPEPIACLVAIPMQWLTFVARPFVALLSGSTHLLMRLLPIKQQHSASVTEEEIQALLAEGSDAGVIEPQQHDMMRNLFRLDDRKLGSIMIPTADVKFLDVNLSVENNLTALIESDHSRFPVCEGSMDHILGVIHSRQALAVLAKGGQLDFRHHLTPAIYVPEMLTAMELLEKFRTNHLQMTFVVDEYGTIKGMVTLRDLLEAVTGEFTPLNDEDAWAIQREDGSWLLDGIIPIPEMKDRLKLTSLPDEDKGRYHTLGGMMMLLLGKVASPTDYVEWQGWRFEVVDMDGKKIDKILATRTA